MILGQFSVKDTDTIGRFNGVACYMEKFSFLFGVVLGELILGHADNLSKSLQVKTLTAAEGQEQAKLTIKTLKSIQTESMFDLIWEKILQLANDFEIDPPTLPRHRKKPKRYEDGSAPVFPESPKEYYRESYNETLNVVTSCIQDRFEQPDFEIYRDLQDVVIKAAKGEVFQNELSSVSSFYDSDINPTRLKIQLELLASHFSEIPSSSIDFHIVLDFLKSLQHHEYFSEVVSLVKLTLVLPATNATSERSFSSLRRIKSYLRSTMAQVRLNHLMVLYAHRDRTDTISLKDVANEFVSGNETRQFHFGNF